MQEVIEMPEISEGDRLHELKARQLKMLEKVKTNRAQLRKRYAHIVRSLLVERMRRHAGTTALGPPSKHHIVAACRRQPWLKPAASIQQLDGAVWS
ncbi:hypothetical protein JQK15_21410 [Sphingobium sp. BHU LFT2]|uniref:hypothetical protein n=1 Tax=Sphingobium sp. BHU LFT2 TaxID=2807634 RepID=UPI001BE55BC5|nr:hypothetical protein [Sphingobium sp. BHU LFT2]MBT2246068.1 hypothetical protein [Sphingobium sp. BHU LFT2]